MSYRRLLYFLFPVVLFLNMNIAWSADETGGLPYGDGIVKPQMAVAPLATSPAPEALFQVSDQIQAIIQSILSKLGLLPPGSRIIIVPPTTQPGGATVAQPPVTQPAQQAAQASTSKWPPRASAGAKNDVAAKFGTQLTEGEGYWSEGQTAAASEALDRLPVFFRKSTKDIRRQGYRFFGKQNLGILGYVSTAQPNQVNLMNMACMTKSQFQGTLVHEMTHCFQNDHPDVAKAFKTKFWGWGIPRPGSVSAYGNTQPLEDMAESVRVYCQSGQKMKQSQPERFAFIKQYVMGGVEYP